ncbi:MAG TPA: BON domain-containing protein [Methylophilaceae bacterium]|nr:BON domain-containing protein [Methylophilaceae bacterium]
MHINFKMALTQSALVLIMATQLTACLPAVVGGAAAGGMMAADRRTSGIYIEDEGIEIKAEKNIADQLGDKIHVNVTSYNRNVLITGEAEDEATKAKAEAIVKAVDNVRSVTNELAVDMKSTIANRNNDAYVTSKVKARMLKEGRFPANYVKVVTESSVVYLLGLVTHKEAEDAVEIASSTDGVYRVVKVFEYID